jgi:hypothetical protein
LCFVEVVVPLDTVPIENCDEVAGKETIGAATRREEDDHQRGHPSPEQVNSLDGDVPEALLFYFVCAQETERKNSFAAGYVMCSREIN